MTVQMYPRQVDVYRGEDRTLIIPFIDHRGGHRILADKFYICECDDFSAIVKKISEAFNFIEESPISTRVERKNPNCYGSKYKTWKSFFKNHIIVTATLYESGDWKIGADVKLPANSTYEEVGKAILQIMYDEERELAEEAEKEAKPQSTSYLVEDELSGNDNDDYKITFQINNSFCEVKSHAMEILRVFIYAPGYDPEFDESIDESSVPCFTIDEASNYEIIDEYKETGTFTGAMELVPLSGKFLFKAKIDHGNSIEYFYAIDACDGGYSNVAFCMTYPKSYKDTDDEKKIMSYLDEIAESYVEERII